MKPRLDYQPLIRKGARARHERAAEIEPYSYEARRTSKEQSKIPRFMLEGPRLCAIFCLRSYTMHKLRDKELCRVS